MNESGITSQYGLLHIGVERKTLWMFFLKISH